MTGDADQRMVYLSELAAGAAGGELIEIRYLTATGRMRCLFVTARRLNDAARAIRSLAPACDVYCGVLLRTRRAGGRDAVGRSHLVWVEIDRPDALERLRRFGRPPSMIVTSGTPGHAHAYWTLAESIDPDALESANRTLARHLGGDLASVDAARILRPPGTLSHKHAPPAPVELVHVDHAARYALDELLAGLPAETRAARSAARSRAPRTARSALDEQLLAIPAATYVRVLAGREPLRTGKVTCPLHAADDTPSLQLYEDGTFYCYGCQTGGSIYDFASRLWGLETKGREFLELRQRLADTFALTTSAR